MEKVVNSQTELGHPFMVTDLGHPFMVTELGHPFMVTDLVHNYQMICLRGTKVIEHKPNEGCTWVKLNGP